MKRITLPIAALFLITAACLVAVGWYAHSWYHHSCEKPQRRVKASGYRFTSPLLDVELPEGLTVNSEPLSFKYKIADLVKSQTDGVNIQSISVYYRDLMDGPWFGINEEQEFNPASMMKVPVMIAWLKRAERHPEELSRSFVFDGAEDMSAFQVHKPRHTLQPGKRYAVDELLRYMLSYSDNNATKLLYENLKAEELNSVLEGMDVDNRPHDDVNSITVHGYSGFFRMLYNASYLTREMSEKALELLSKEDFSQGISAGVPRGTLVAAKFGESTDGPQNERKQLHEFGIVYHPKGPYIIGIMTMGKDFDRQAKVIRDISAMVYAEVNSTVTPKSR